MSVIIGGPRGPRHRFSAVAQDRGDGVDEGGGVPPERRSQVTAPVQGGIIGQCDRAEPGPGGARHLNVGGGLERFGILSDPQIDGQSLVLQGSADLPLEGKAPYAARLAVPGGASSR